MKHMPRSRPTIRRARRPRPLVSFAATLFVLGLGLTASGCASARWTYNYPDAERAAAAQERDLLIFYRDHLDLSSADLDDMLESPALAPALKNYVLCSLVAAYAPNRRYVAQFGVTTPPALIVVHPDGTYHAKTDSFTPEAITAFLASAKAPGAKPTRDISVPRPTDFLLHAEGVYERAVEKADRLNRDLLIVYKWWLDDESTKLLARLSRPEVAVRCANTVTCILDWDYVPNRKYVAKYGVTRYPAIIVVHRDDTADVLEGPASVERIIGFLSRTLPGTTQPVPGAQLSAARPGWRWFTNLDRAQAQAERNETGLFIFVHDPTDATSAQMMQLLQSGEAADYLDKAVKCSLTDDPEIRSMLSVYGVDAVPAFIAVRDDGNFRKASGAITLDDLRDLAQFLE
ncbi:MAG TPA: hypothetical protein P5572_00105 [Phycisphaerae bacterium]|nr:hypothetical protein [Phycisphaerales bacterium]HRX83399.1 hypothetical protein [Phycisphaerae bacterium]